MQPISMELDPYLQNQVDNGVLPLDLMHGHLKTLVLEAEQEFEEAQRIEEDNDYSDAMESMERKYWEGMLDAYNHIYALTYQLSFAYAERENNG